jgi:hypothetical protein
MKTLSSGRPLLYAIMALSGSPPDPAVAYTVPSLPTVNGRACARIPDLVWFAVLNPFMPVVAQKYIHIRDEPYAPTGLEQSD